jgi:uracil-DNA glycosylase
MELKNYFPIDSDWMKILSSSFDDPKMKALDSFLAMQWLENHQIFPRREDVFKAFELTSFTETKVVLLGQDVYHGDHQAHGLSFSVPIGQPIPPSLRNIFKEMQDDLQVHQPLSGCLEHWAEQGILLLNTILTVRKGLPGSHARKGWEFFTDQVITALSERSDPVLFLLLGNYAHSKKIMINTKIHTVFETSHPSPLSAYRGFFGSKPFTAVNQFLLKNQLPAIEWVRV